VLLRVGESSVYGTCESGAVGPGRFAQKTLYAKLYYMTKLRKDVKFQATLPPDVHDWLKIAAAERSDIGMTMNRLLTDALRYYMTRPEDALDADGRRVCCGTDPRHGHRGTCRYSAMRSADSAEYQALRAMWDSKNQDAGS
jgi:hypothetical protein